MKIFVPRYRHTAPSTNGEVLDEMFLEIHADDLSNVIKQWSALDQLKDVNFGAIKPKDFFSIKAKDACKLPVQNNSLEPFLRRPQITAHCGSKSGSKSTSPIALNLMYEAGQLIARNGFNLWYGGGKTGLMGEVNRGFTDALKEERFPDQYSVQVIPAPFVHGVKTANGLRPSNEGLCDDSDAAIIMPDFVTRRELLSSKCAAAFSGIGGTGSLDEITDILVHIKTGLRPTTMFILDPYIPELDRTYWQPLRELIEGFIKTGFEQPLISSHFSFVSNAHEAMDSLLANLDNAGQNPHTVYAEYCRAKGIKPKPVQRGVQPGVIPG